MIKPMKTRMAVTVNIQRSTLTRLAMGNSFHHGDTEARRFFHLGFGAGVYSFGSSGRGSRGRWLFAYGQRMHDFLEDPSPAFVVLKLGEAGAGRSEENDGAGGGGFAGPADSSFQGLAR